MGAMVVALLGILWLAVRSTRIVLAILCTTLIGLVLTAAIGLVATGRFNLISVAFIPLFVGLGVDFSIQFSVRSLAERGVRPDLELALVATGAAIGKALALSAAAIGAGFFAFLPTSYLGVAELGTVAGLGMGIAFVLTIVLLPALLVMLRAPQGGLAGSGLHRAGAGRFLRAPPPPAGAGHRAHRRGGLPGAAAVAALRLQSARSQERPGGVDDHAARHGERSRLDARRHQRACPIGRRRGVARAPAGRAAGSCACRQPQQLRARVPEGTS